MLTVSEVTNSGDATRYYSHDNYYTQDQGIEHSQWLGAGSEDLGLSGQVDPDSFAALLNGQVDGEQLGRTTKGGIKHRPGWDLTFSAPKSVSILSEVYGLKEVREAHSKAVKEALTHIEKSYLQTRLSVNGEVIRLKTDNAVFATFTHDVSRELDPQLHTHAVLINATKTPHGWRSIANEKLIDRNAIMEGGMAYRMTLARELTEKGFTLQQHRDPRLFEVDGIPSELMEEFSKRSSQIKAYFENRGLAYDSAYAKQVALLTRRRKEAVPREELGEIWKERAAGHTLSAAITGRRPAPGSGQDGAVSDKKQLRRDVQNAINHLLEKDMSFTELELKKETMRLGLGRDRYSDLDAEIQRLKRSAGLVEGRRHTDVDYKEVLWTTRVAKQAEQRLISQLEAGQIAANGKALVGAKKAEAFLKNTGLNDQQQAAVLAAVQSQSRYFGIQGDPGVGKTTTLKAYKQLLERSGYQVMGFAPSYQAVNEMTKSLSVPGMTVDRFLVDKFAQDKGGRFTKQVWIVDETSMLGTDKINQLMAQAQQKEARVLFVGDHQQLESVGAGRGFKQLQDAGIELATINKRMRQKTDQLREVVDHVMAKRYSEAFDTMDRAGQVVQAIDPMNRREPLEALSAEYLSRTPEQRANTLVVAPTNEQRHTINGLIRAGLRDQGIISGKENVVSSFADVTLTEQEKKLAGQYQKGQYVRFNYQYRDPKAKLAIDRHEYFQVVGSNKDTNIIALRAQKGGRVVCIDPSRVGADRPGGLQVFTEETIALAKGDRLRWLDNSNREGLKRNTEMTVVRSTAEWVRLEDSEGKSYSLPLTDFRHRHFEHDYARTAYGVQGKTSQDVLAVMESYRKNTVNQRSFMVSVTRASHDLKVFVDDRGKLKQALMRRSGDNTEALTEPEFTRAKQRGNARAQEPARRAGIRQII